MFEGCVAACNCNWMRGVVLAFSKAFQNSMRAYLDGPFFFCYFFQNTTPNERKQKRSKHAQTKHFLPFVEFASCKGAPICGCVFSTITYNRNEILDDLRMSVCVPLPVPTELDHQLNLPVRTRRTCWLLSSLLPVGLNHNVDRQPAPVEQDTNPQPYDTPHTG